MEDPTKAKTSAAYERVWRKEIERTLTEQPNVSFVEVAEFKKKVIERRKAIQEERLKCTSSYASYFIMTINMKGKGKKAGKGIGSDQKKLTSIITRNFFSSVIFCPEIPGYFRKDVVEECGTGGYDFHRTGNEAAVIWRVSDFRGKPINTYPSVVNIVEDLQKRSDLDVSEVHKRTAMVKLTSHGISDGTRASFLAVSWHGNGYNNNLETRRKQFYGLIRFVHKVCEKEQLSSFIIGGDFNLNTLEDVNVEQHGVIIPGYKLLTWDEKLPNNHRFKDNFVFTRSGGLAVSWVRPLEYQDSEHPESAIAEEDLAEFKDQRKTTTEWKNILDHAPVVGVLKLKSLPYKKSAFKQDGK